MNPFTGALGYRIPIVTPPGRNGIAPNLALTYNSQARNGLAGIGWTIDLGSIQRNTKYGLDYTNNYGPFPYPFVAAINGATSYLMYDSTWGCYRSVIEGAFSKYCFINETSWIVTAKDGTKYFYGSSDVSRQDDPKDPRRVFKWCLGPKGTFLPCCHILTPLLFRREPSRWFPITGRGDPAAPAWIRRRDSGSGDRQCLPPSV